MLVILVLIITTNSINDTSSTTTTTTAAATAAAATTTTTTNNNNNNDNNDDNNNDDNDNNTARGADVSRGEESRVERFGGPVARVNSHPPWKTGTGSGRKPRAWSHAARTGHRRRRETRTSALLSRLTIEGNPLL